MTLIEFIKSKLSTNNPIGDLAKDILHDKNFSVNKSEQEIISYLDFNTKKGGTNKEFKQLIRQYKKHLLSSPKNDKFEDVIESKYSLLRTETWNFYKENFAVNKVYLIGEPTDIYKVYCVNTERKKALYFNLKSKNNLNDISPIDESKIFIGNLTQQTTIGEAINALENCKYDEGVSTKPDTITYKELLNFLKANLKN